MAGITGLGTTFNLPNYTGELFALTPADTPLLSAIGGLGQGKQTAAPEFEWQYYDLRDPGQRARLEGANAPTAEERVRGNARSVVEIHQEAVSVSYTKMAATAMKQSPTSAPFTAGVALGSDPSIDELSWQIEQMVKTKALDVNWTFWHGEYNLPTDNTTARKTRGLLQAIETNRTLLGTVTESAALTSSTDTIAEVGTPLANNDVIVFTQVGTAAGVLVPGRKYWVSNKATDSFKVKASSGGSVVTIGTATGIKYTKPRTASLTIDEIDDLAQKAYDNGGLSEQFTATIVCNSGVRRQITSAFATAYGQQAGAVEGNVGGVRVDVVKTNFGQMNIMLDRHFPVDGLAFVSLEQLSPVFLEIPGKGVFFVEPLSKVGAAENYQLYGEVGLAYGNEKAHAVMRGLKV